MAHLKTGTSVKSFSSVSSNKRIEIDLEMSEPHDGLMHTRKSVEFFTSFSWFHFIRKSMLKTDAQKLKPLNFVELHFFTLILPPFRILLF
jgi:hypothetical protein